MYKQNNSMIYFYVESATRGLNFISFYGAVPIKELIV